MKEKYKVSRFTETQQLIKVDDMPLSQLIIDKCQTVGCIRNEVDNTHVSTPASHINWFNFHQSLTSEIKFG